MTSWASQHDQHIARALGRAIRHVRRVAIRPHIRTDRDERLNQFVVSIRRELTVLRGQGHIGEGHYFAVNDSLTEKKFWYDVGEINATAPSMLLGGYNSRHAGYTVLLEDLRRWLRLSKHLENETEAQAYDIATDIEEIEKGIGCLEDSVDEVRRINQEGDKLTGQLAALFS